MRRVKIYAVTAIWAVSMLLFPNFASAGAITSTTNLEVPLAISVLVPCANGGAGEVVDVSGTLHVLLHFTLSDSGRVTLKEHFQPQGASGVGETTGDIYRAVGVTQDIQTSDGVAGPPFEFTFVNNFRIIGQGPGNNVLIHENLHVTINANGDVVSFHDDFSAECK